jgi:hypothetical protein
MTRLESRNNEVNLGGGRGGGGLRPSRGSGPLGRGGLGRGMENRPPRSSLTEDSREYGMGKHQFMAFPPCSSS